MVLSHHGQLEFGSPVLPLTREALLLSMIDNLDSKMLVLDKAFVDAVTKVGRRFLTDDFHHTTCQFAIQLIVAREHCNLLVRELLSQLEIRHTSLDAHLLCLVRSCHNTSVVVRQNNNRLAIQVRSEHPFTTDVTIITIDDSVHAISTP